MKLIQLTIAACLLVHAGMAQVEKKGTIFLSRDEGESWISADKGFPSEAFITSLAYSSSTVIVGTQDDGIYISTDGLRSWQPSNHGLPKSAKIKALHAVRGVVFAGTYSDGAFISYDQGNSWTASGLTNLSIQFHNFSVRCFFTKGNTVYAGTDDGIYFSNDMGKNWSKGFDGVQINVFTEHRGTLYAATNGGVIRAVSPETSWEWVWHKAGVFDIASDGTEVVAVLGDSNSYIGTGDGTWFRPAKNFVVNTFKMTPVSTPIPIAPWRNSIKAFRTNSYFRGDGLPDDQPFSKLINTPYGIVAVATAGGC